MRNERFTILRRLGQGGMGIVYEAHDQKRRESVALKTIRSADLDAMYRLKQEFRSLADIEHPNLVRLHDLFVSDDESFFTMEHIDGLDFVRACARSAEVDTVAETLDARAHLPFDETVLRNALADVALGVEALHGFGLIHRDLKPSNVMVRRDGSAVLLDFGLVVNAHAPEQLSVEGTIVGTIAYMAPEQARGEAELTFSVDWYAVGAMLYEALTGCPPFDGHPLKVLGDKQRCLPPRPSTVVKNLPADLEALAMDLLAIDPTARPRSAEIFERLGVASSTRSSSSLEVASRGVFGRDAELRELEAAYALCEDGQPSGVLVTGRSGIGKSALLGHFARIVERRERAIVLASRCHEWETVAFKGLDGVIDALSRYLGRLGSDDVAQLMPPDLGDLGTVFPMLRRHKRIAAAHARRTLAHRPPQQVRQSAFACLREMLRRIAEAHPLVVVIDDVQWADEDSAMALRSLLVGEHAPALLLLLGSRPMHGGGDAPVVRLLLDSQGVGAGDAAFARMSRVTLEAITDDAMRSLVLRELGTSSDDALVAAIARESRGVPFTAAELVRWARSGARDRDLMDTSVDTLVVRRASKLSRAARRLLDVVAIAGEPIEPAIALIASGGRDEDRAALDELRAGQWIRRAQTVSAPLVDTTHDRIREALVRSIEPGAVPGLHRALALAMETSEHPAHDRLARHFAAANDRGPARHHAVLAARAAGEALAFRRSSELYALAVACSTATERAELLPVLADAREKSGENVAASNAWLDAANESKDSDAARAYRIRAGESLLHAGQVDRGLALLDEAARELGVVISASTTRAVWEVVKARARLAVRGTAHRLRPREQIPASDVARLRALAAIANGVGSIDPVASAALSTRYLIEALDVGHSAELATALAGETFVRAASGDFESAERFLSVLARVAELDGGARARGWLESARAALGFGNGRGGEVAEHAARALEAFESDPQVQPWERSQAYFSLAASGLMSGDFALCQRAAQYAAERVELAGEAAELRLRTSLLVVFEIVRGNIDRAAALADPGVWGTVTSRDVAFRLIQTNNRSWTELHSGSVDDAAKLSWQAWEGLERNGFGRTVSLRYDCLRMVAASGAARGDLALCDRAARAFGRPCTELEKYFHSRLLAAIAIAHGDHRHAVRLLDSTWRAATQWGSLAWAAMDRWALMRLEQGNAAAEHRSWLGTYLEPGFVMDPDRFYWTFYPIGPRPPRTGQCTLR